MASTVQDIEKAIAELPQEQLKEFRAWYQEFDANAWDQQIQTDIETGKLDSLAEQALAAHKTGKSRPL